MNHHNLVFDEHHNKAPKAQMFHPYSVVVAITCVYRYACSACLGLRKFDFKKEKKRKQLKLIAMDCTRFRTHIDQPSLLVSTIFCGDLDVSTMGAFERRIRQIRSASNLSAPVFVSLSLQEMDKAAKVYTQGLCKEQLSMRSPSIDDQFGNDWNMRQPGNGESHDLSSCSVYECCIILTSSWKSYVANATAVNAPSPLPQLTCAFGSILTIQTLINNVYLPKTQGNVLHPLLVATSRAHLTIANLLDFEQGVCRGVEACCRSDSHNQNWGLQNKITTNLNAGVVCLQTSFRNCVLDRTAMPNPVDSWNVAENGDPSQNQRNDAILYNQTTTKRTIILPLVNILLRSYATRLSNSLRLSDSVIKPVQTYNLDRLGPMGEQCSFLWWHGNVQLFRDEFEEAERSFERGVNMLEGLGQNFNFEKQRRMFYGVLVPLKMRKGAFPCAKLMDKYFGKTPATPVVCSLPSILLALVKSAKVGNIALYEGILAHPPAAKILIRRGVFLLLEKVGSTVVYRNLLKRVRSAGSADGSRLDIAEVVSAVNFLRARANSDFASSFIFGSSQFTNTNNKKRKSVFEEVMNLDEMECIISNLIWKRLIKGYVSHEKRIVVLSKKEAFPPLHDPQ